MLSSQKDLFNGGTPPDENTDSQNEIRDRIIEKIERCLIFYKRSLSEYPRPTLYLSGCDGCVPVEYFGSYNLHKFACVFTLLNDIYKLVQTNSFQNKRALFYEHRQLFREMRHIDSAILSVCRLLCETRKDLHILSTSKGLLAGDLVLTLQDGTEITCSKIPVSVPSNIDDVVKFGTNAKFVLIVEKDTVFQKLIDENFCSIYGPCILITAKGYPDFATREFILKLKETTPLPVAILVDGDPHGVEIYLTYKFGSTSRELNINNENLQILNLVWLGVFSSEISVLPIENSNNLALNQREKRRLELMLKRPLVKCDNFLVQQLEKMREIGVKIEVEAVSSLGDNYLTVNYLRPKLRKLLKKLSQSQSQSQSQSNSL